MRAAVLPIDLRSPLAFLLIAILLCAPTMVAAQASALPAVVRIAPQRVIRTFDPARSLGAGIDGHDAGELDRRLKPNYISEMLSAGLGPVSYRLRTELGDEAWHWNPLGKFSDSAGQQGYWTSSTEPSAGGISLSYGYRLPRRGNSIDQANNDSYSRIDDGDEASFWKSNPYLDAAFTHENNSLHQQWVIIDLEQAAQVNAIKIVWGDQFATRFEVDYTTNTLTSDFGLRPEGGWRKFPTGDLAQTHPDASVHKLSAAPVKVRFIRILLRNAAHAGIVSRDIRDNIGFAIREIYVGTQASRGSLTDRISHTNSGKEQSPVFVSSTDPWHRASDLDKGEEHIGFDRLVATGLTRGQPMMVPVGILYDTPENAAAEIKYLTDRGIKFDRVELGEEPDGQNVAPADYGAMYVQFAEAIHRVAPDAVLGGPSFQDIVSNLSERENHAGNGRWLSEVLGYLARRGHKQDFGFMSFEWYPYDNVCVPTAPQVAGSADFMKRAIEAMWDDGLDRDIPLVVSEYGYSPYATAAEDDLEGAIVNLDGVGTLLSMNADAAYLYGYEPDDVQREVPCTEGNNMILEMMPNESLKKTSTFHAARMMTSEWLQPAGGSHDLIAATSSNSKVGVYAVRRPDGKLSVLLLNRDPDHRATASVQIDGRSSTKTHPVDVIQFSHAQYQWDVKLRKPIRDDPPAHSAADLTKAVDLPPYSITVLREK
ncbi:MAG: discoidin domain-containing protein [Pyrinomonadaceae bacterium]